MIGKSVNELLRALDALVKLKQRVRFGGSRLAQNVGQPNLPSRSGNVPICSVLPRWHRLDITLWRKDTENLVQQFPDACHAKSCANDTTIHVAPGLLAKLEKTLIDAAQRKFELRPDSFPAMFLPLILAAFCVGQAGGQAAGYLGIAKYKFGFPPGLCFCATFNPYRLQIRCSRSF